MTCCSACLAQLGKPVVAICQKVRVFIVSTLPSDLKALSLSAKCLYGIFGFSLVCWHLVVIWKFSPP